MKTYKIASKPVIAPLPPAVLVAQKVAEKPAEALLRDRPGIVGTVNRTNFTASSSAWTPKGQPIKIAGYTITGGMLYVGTTAHGGPPPARRFIDSALPVSRTRDISVPQMGYFPDYRAISPAQRRNYLEWLAGGRSNPSIEIGYVFLFYYGLEERIAALDCTAQEELHILEEVLRLRQIYSTNGSFKGYSAQFCDCLMARQHCQNPVLALKAAPDLNKLDLKNAMRHVAAIARCLADNIPLDFTKAYAGAVIYEFAGKHRSARLPTLMTQRMLTAAKIVFDEKFPNGFLPHALEYKPLKIPYRTAMGYGEVDFAQSKGNNPAADLSSYDWSGLTSLISEVETNLRHVGTDLGVVRK
jgi:hypothetical protein